MLTDTWTVMSKEWKEMFAMGGGGERGRWSFLIFLGVFGLFLPLQFGVQGVETGQSVIFFAWVPVLLVTNVIVDSFAGERERHTLETLLATRLPDNAILFGKMLAAVAYAFVLTIGSLIVGIAAVNIVYRPPSFVIYPAPLMGIALVVALLGALLAAGIGVLVSLRAPSARQAQQSMGLAMILLFVPFYVIPYLPASIRASAASGLSSIPVGVLAGAALLLVVVLNAITVRAVMARFQRSRLILD